MAVTKIVLEIDVEDTFQNGSKLDLEAMYALINSVAEDEYNRQFDANMLQRRFGMSVSGNGVPVALNATLPDGFALVDNGDVVTPTELSDSQTNPAMIKSRAKRRGLSLEKIESRLFLPGFPNSR